MDKYDLIVYTGLTLGLLVLLILAAVLILAPLGLSYIAWQNQNIYIGIAALVVALMVYVS